MRVLQEASEWMKVKHFKLNESKTEVMFIGSKSTLRKVEHIKTVNLRDESVKNSRSAKNIGVIFDETLSLSLHINNITKTSYYHLFFFQISRIRQYLTENAATKLVCSLILPRLDYANSLLFGLPDILLDKLQMVQNSAARLILRKRKRDHHSSVLWGKFYKNFTY